MSPSDPELSGTLKCWRHEPPPAPQFNAEVWARIAAKRNPRGNVAAFLRDFLGISVQPVRWMVPLAASVVLVLAAIAGAGVGSLRTSRVRNERMAAAYVRTIDPLQMPMAPPSP